MHAVIYSYSMFLIHIGIAFVAYSPVGSPGRPEIPDTEPVVLDDPVVKEIADKLKITPAQVYNTGWNLTIFNCSGFVSGLHCVFVIKR